MPAKSAQQQKAAGMALSAKRGDTSASKLKGAAKQMYESMSKRELEDMAGKKRKDLPRRKKSEELSEAKPAHRRHRPVLLDRGTK